jgi:hypothetical protein
MEQTVLTFKALEERIEELPVHPSMAIGPNKKAQ